MILRTSRWRLPGPPPNPVGAPTALAARRLSVRLLVVPPGADASGEIHSIAEREQRGPECEQDPRRRRGDDLPARNGTSRRVVAVGITAAAVQHTKLSPMKPSAKSLRFSYIFEICSICIGGLSGAVTGGIGRVQRGQDGAAVLSSRSQSGRFVSGITFPTRPSGRRRHG